MLAQLDSVEEAGYQELLDQIDACIDAFVSGDEDAGKLFKCLDSLMEDPTLIDSRLSTWMTSLASMLMDALENNHCRLNSIFHAFNQFIKIRGIETIRQFFPHDLKTVKRLIRFALSFQSDDWVDRTMLMLWLSMAVLVPFKLEDSTCKALMEMAKGRLHLSGKEGKAACLLLSSLFRREGSEVYASDFINWAVDYLKVETLLEFASSLLKGGYNGSHELKRIKSRVITGGHCLRLFLKCSSRLAILHPEDTELVQETLNCALNALKERDTNVRWSAAKVLGRLCTVIDPSQVAALLKLIIESAEGADMLHGSCLAIGQILSSLSYSSPQGFVDFEDSLVEFVVKCLRFEQPKGTFSIGSNVRDAACYLCWSWCRSCPKMNKSIVQRLSCALLCLSIFDREIFCRRAASAAFQELSGRTGLVPLGIEIMLKINYFSISNLQSCFSELFNFATGFMEYRAYLIDYIMNVTSQCFDKNVRILAANALATQRLDRSIVKKLIYYVCGEELVLIHFGLTTISDLIISSNEDAEYMAEKLNEKLIQFSSLPNSRKLGYELLAESWLQYIRSMAISNVAFDLSTILEVLKTALRSRSPVIHQRFAYPALQAISQRSQPSDPLLTSFYRTVVLPAADKDPDMNAQRGYSAVIGTMPNWLLLERADPLSNLLCRLACAKEPINDIEKRTLIIKAIGQLYGRPGLVFNVIIQKLYDCLISLMSDYSIDFRGDVGSFIRESAMTSLCQLKHHLDEAQVLRVQLEILGQAVDRLDRVRWCSYELLSNFSPWPIQLPFPLGKSTPPSKLLDSLPSSWLTEKPIISGWINSAGCLTPSIGDPSFVAFLKHQETILPCFYELCDELFRPDHRLCHAYICVLTKLRRAGLDIPDFSEKIEAVLRSKCPNKIKFSCNELRLLL